MKPINVFQISGEEMTLVLVARDMPSAVKTWKEVVADQNDLDMREVDEPESIVRVNDIGCVFIDMDGLGLIHSVETTP